METNDKVGDRTIRVFDPELERSIIELAHLIMRDTLVKIRSDEARRQANYRVQSKRLAAVERELKELKNAGGFTQVPGIS